LSSIIAVVGARPNFMKIAPVMDRLRAAGVEVSLVHTGQHYDESMSDSFFRQLGIPEPDVDLEVGSATHAVQTAEIMIRFEPVLERYSPSAVVVVGDVNSTIACALVAAKREIPVVHIEAGLRSFDRTMPEEINRVLTDQLSEILFTTERGARENLKREGVSDERIHFVGNVMIDSLLGHLDRAVPVSRTLAALGRNPIPEGDPYGVVTLHRPSNVDEPGKLRTLMAALVRVSERVPLVFPVHPRTASRLENLGFSCPETLIATPPVGYFEMLGLMRDAKLVLTDSGGMQEETTALGVPCLTLRENTERPITVSEGTNTIVGRDPARIENAVDAIVKGGGKSGRRPELWDGKASARIRDVLVAWLEEKGTLDAVILRGEDEDRG
jgi:UDP-N-acetylglucosamine 2-epimerase (non-hydrolysing)